MWPNSLGSTSGCSGGAGATDLGGLAASTTSASELFGPAAFGASAAGPYGALKTNPYVSALGMPPIEALHTTIGYPGCTPAGESYYCECPSSYTTSFLPFARIALHGIVSRRIAPHRVASHLVAFTFLSRNTYVHCFAIDRTVASSFYLLRCAFAGQVLTLCTRETIHSHRFEPKIITSRMQRVNIFPSHLGNEVSHLRSNVAGLNRLRS